MSNTPEISFVIPCYSEEGNLRELVKAIRVADQGCNAIAEFYGKK